MLTYARPNAGDAPANQTRTGWPIWFMASGIWGRLVGGQQTWQTKQTIIIKGEERYDKGW